MIPVCLKSLKEHNKEVIINRCHLILDLIHLRMKYLFLKFRFFLVFSGVFLSLQLFSCRLFPNLFGQSKFNILLKFCLDLLKCLQADIDFFDFFSISCVVVQPDVKSSLTFSNLLKFSYSTLV